MQIKLEPGELLSDALHVAVMQALGDDAKKVIVSEAVRYLIDKRAGYNGISPLHQAIYGAAERVAREMVEQQLREGELKPAIHTLVSEALGIFLEKQATDKSLANEMARAIERSFNSADR